MRCFKHIEPFEVISFDLDDTLYDNTVVIAKAEHEFASFLCQNFNLDSKANDPSFWSAIKDKLIIQDAYLEDDVSLLRAHVLYQGLTSLKGSSYVSFENCKELVTHFINIRSNVTVSKEVIELLAKLGQHYILVAISNGNVDIKKIGLADIFAYDLRPSYKIHRKKPHSDLFEQAKSIYNISSKQILHVGDDPITDVQGSVLANCQCAFLDKGYAKKLKGQESLMQVPHLILDSIFELRYFIHG